MDKAKRYLALARKAGLLAVGEESCGEAADAGKARLMLLARDASPNAARRAESFLRGRRAPLRTVPLEKAELSLLLGRPGCSMVCFTDLGLARRFADAMAEELPEWSAAAELLTAREEKARRRKALPKKHTSPNRRT